MIIQRTKKIIESTFFHQFIIGLIIINAIIIGFQVSNIESQARAILSFAENIILYIFITEMALRLLVYRKEFFKDPWSWFDIVVIAIPLLYTNHTYSIVRILRVLRIFRIISAIPRLKKITSGLISSIPHIGLVAFIMSLILYVFAVIAVDLYGAQYPEWFGDIGLALFTLLEIMTLQWADMARDIMKTHPYAWVFFVSYILVIVFTILNLFTAVIIDSM